MEPKPKTVLVVEDEAHDRLLIQELLSPEGLTLITAEDGAAALAALAECLPDLVIVDLMLPGDMDGFQLARRLKSVAPTRHIPILILTALQDRESRLQALELGVEEFICKPVDRAEVLARVRNLLRLKEYQDFLADHSRILEEQVAERTLALSRESHRNEVFLRNASDGVHIFDSEGNVLEVSDSFCDMLGYSREELIGANVSLWDVQWSPQELQHRLAELYAQEGRSAFETRHRRRDGSHLDVEVTTQRLELDGEPALFNSARDITERKQALDALRAAEEQFRGLVEQTIAGIYIIQNQRFAYLNPRFAEIFGYASADELIGCDPLSVVVEKDHDIVDNNMRLRDAGEVRSSNYSITGRRKDGSLIEVGLNSAYATYRGRPAVIGLLQDISEKKRAEEQIQGYIAQLKTAFMSTVEVATTLSEMRDPYTAGHERRVAEIAVAIGAGLGFDARRQEGLRVAGYLHDVGKITIPSEILSKPGKLSAIEYRLIKGHAQASYEVLKNVKFPWPVAEVALQHHERLDGSGYPQRLKGEAILLEARILAVADVVEAMSSHRPYRPGLGIDQALAEIERGRGSAYDPAVADACLTLFRDKGYAIPA